MQFIIQKRIVKEIMGRSFRVTSYAAYTIIPDMSDAISGGVKMKRKESI